MTAALTARDRGRLGGRPPIRRAWTAPVHLSDGVHLQCPARVTPIRTDPTGPGTCPVHGQVVAQFVPLVPWATGGGDNRYCSRCGCGAGSRPKHERWLCDDCLEVVDRQWCAVLATPVASTFGLLPGEQAEVWR